jgi:hypothetical protein
LGDRSVHRIVRATQLFYLPNAVKSDSVVPAAELAADMMAWRRMQ